MAVRLSGRTSVDLLHRPGQAVQSFLTGDMDATWRSMLSPESLGPAERDALLTKWGIQHDSFQGRLLDTITNPGVLLSVLLTFRFPVPTARNLFKAKAGVDGMLAKIPVLRSFASPRTAFNGTPVPGILDDILFAKNEIFSEYMERRLGPAFAHYERETGKAISAADQAIVFNWLRGLHKKPLPGWEGAGILYPNLDRHMTSPMRRLAGVIRETIDHTNEKVWLNPEYADLIRKGHEALSRSGTADETLEQLATFLGQRRGVGDMVDFMPLHVTRTELDLKRLRDATVATMNNADISKAKQYEMLEFLGRDYYSGKGAAIPNLQELMVLGDRVDKNAYLRLTNMVKDRIVGGMSDTLGGRSLKRLERMSLDEILSKGQKVVEPGEVGAFSTALAEHMPKQYSAKLEPVLQKYYHSVAATYAWTIKGHGSTLLGEVQRAKALAKVDSRAAWRAHVLENTIVPTALGKPTPRQTINAGLWDQRMGGIVATLDRPAVRGLVGDRFANTLKEYYQANQGSFSLRGLVMKAASYFYLSTLGLNPAAAFKNQFQSIITTGPLVGFDNAFSGQIDAWKRASKYFDARMSQKLSHSDALAKVYPEFSLAGLAGSPLTDEALGRAYDAAYRIHKTAPNFISVADRVKRASMAMFTASETSVRLGAFHAGLRHAARDGLRGAEAIEHARRVVVRSQFLPTLADQPIVFSQGGALSNPLLRQLAQFPIRTLEFTVEGVQDAFGGNPARLLRQVAGSYITYEVGDVLGVNLGDALIQGAFPAFTDVNEKGTILAPLPIVPPVVALTAGLASDLGSGSWESTHRNLPLLVPGGVGLARAIGFMPGPADIPQRTARWLNRKYADYDQTNPMTGRIPVYTGAGNLTGYYKPWELVRHVLGIPGGQIEQEAEMAQRLTKDATLIKDSRRRYVDALFANDARKASGIEAEYESRFGHKLTVTQEQIEQMQQRRKMTRIEKQLSTLPREARPAYEQQVFGSRLAPSISSGRYKSLTSPPPNYTNDLGPLDDLDPYAISRYRNVPQTTP